MGVARQIGEDLVSGTAGSVRHAESNGIPSVGSIALEPEDRRLVERTLRRIRQILPDKYSDTILEYAVAAFVVDLSVHAQCAATCDRVQRLEACWQVNDTLAFRRSAPPAEQKISVADTPPVPSVLGELRSAPDSCLTEQTISVRDAEILSNQSYVAGHDAGRGENLPQRSVPLARGGASAGLLDAAEKLARTFISPMSDGSSICTSCQRGSLDGVIPHADTCNPGRLLGLIELERRLQAMSEVTAAERAAASHTLMRALGESREVTCGRQVLVVNDPERRGVRTCTLDRGHGDLFHQDGAIKWDSDSATRITFLSSTRLRIDRFAPWEPLFVTLDDSMEVSHGNSAS